MCKIHHMIPFDERQGRVCKSRDCIVVFKIKGAKRYCSTVCKRRHENAKRKIQNRKLCKSDIRKCVVCTGEYEYIYHASGIKYCSKECTKIAADEKMYIYNQSRDKRDTSKKISEKDGIDWTEPPIGNFIKRKPGVFTKRCSVCTVGITDELNAYYYGDMIICDDKCFQLKHPKTHGNMTNKPSPVIDILFPAGYRGHVNGQRNVG